MFAPGAVPNTPNMIHLVAPSTHNHQKRLATLAPGEIMQFYGSFLVAAKNTSTHSV